MSQMSAVSRRPLSAAAILVGQAWHAGHRPDLPSLSNQDPSAVLGDPANPSLKVALLGDSSVTAPGVEPLDDCWARRVGHRLAATYHVRMVSIAAGGARAADVLRYQVAPALAEEPDIALVCVGANDALRSVAVQDFESDLRAILSALAKTVPAVGVSGLGDLGPLPRLPTIGSAWARVRARSFDRAIARTAHELDVPKTAAWGPLFQPFEDPLNEGGVYAPDLFHASGKGHALFAEAWFEVVDVLLERLELRANARPGSSESST